MALRLSGLDAFKKRTNPDFNLAILEWFSEPSLQVVRFERTDRVKIGVSAKPRTTKEIWLVQPDRSIYLEALEVKGNDLFFDLEEWDNAEVALEKLKATKVAYPREWIAKPKGLLSEKFAIALDEIQLKIDEETPDPFEGLSFEEMKRAASIEASVKKLRGNSLITEEPDTTFLERMLDVLGEENFRIFKKMTQAESSVPITKYLSGILEAYFEMPMGHLKTLPASLAKAAHAEIVRVQTLVEAMPEYIAMRPPSEEPADDESATAKKTTRAKKPAKR